MRRVLVVLSVGLATAFPFHVAAEQSVQDADLRVFVECHDGAILEKQKDYIGALVLFQDSLSRLQRVHDKNPDWQQAMVLKRIEDCRQEVAKLEPMATQQVHDLFGGTSDSKLSLSFEIESAAKLEKTDEYGAALYQSERCLFILKTIHHNDPKWEATEIDDKIKQLQDEIARLNLEIDARIEKRSGASVQD